LLQAYVRSDTTAKDLLYHYDSLRRFGQAQHGDTKEKEDARDARRFIDLMPLGRALASSTRRVLLLDEIDKAPRDLPNDLLRELDQGRFTIAEIPRDAESRYGADDRLPQREMGFGQGAHGAPQKPFIIVTSNQERQLPNAFLRRCAFCHLELPKAETLEEILEGHFEKKVSADERKRLVRTFSALRKQPSLMKPPGTSELIAWVRALVEVLPSEQRRKAVAFEPGVHAWKDLPGRMTLIKLPEDERKLA
ncbi:MAG: MoxR family ATPase, partial [Myxococcota bacterium]